MEAKAGVLRALRSLIGGGGSLRRSSCLRRRPQGRRCSTGEAEPEERHRPHQEPRSAWRRSFSLNGRLESQLQRLNFSEQEEALALASTQREVKRRSLSLQPSPTDMLQVLEEDFSVQSMASITTEDCFYDSRQKESPPMLKLAR